MDELNQFIHSRKIAKGSDFTHLSMDNPKIAFYVQADENDEFIKLYQKVKMGTKSIVEFQNTNTMFRMDIDLKFINKTPNYNDEFITNLIDLIRTELVSFSSTLENVEIQILKRPKHYKRKEFDDYKKNGLHLLIPKLIESYDHLVKYVVNKLVNNLEIKKLLDDIMIVENSFTDVFDTSIYNTNGFMMLGSDKISNNKNCYKPYCKSSSFGNITKYDNNEIKKNYENLVQDFSIRCKHKTIDKILDEDGNAKYDALVQINREKEVEQLKQIRKQREKTRTYNQIVDIDEILELVYVLDNERAEHYDTWSEIGWILYNISEDLLYVFNAFSKLCGEKYDEDEVDKFWLNCKKGNYTIGSLYHFVRIDNLEQYNRIRAKYIKFNENQYPNWNDDDLAKYFSQCYQDKFIYQAKKIYQFNEVYWKIDTEDISILKFIPSVFHKKLQKLSIQLRKEEEDKITDDCEDRDEKLEKIDELFTLRKKNLLNLKTNKFIENLVKVIKRFIHDEDVEFNTMSNLFAFENKIWDLNENKFIEPNPNQYISLTSGYVYDGKDEDKEIIIGEIIDKIFTIDDVKQRALELYSTGLSGYRIAKILIQNGCGGNGKSLLNGMISTMLGNYSIGGNRSIIDINTKKGSGASQEVAELDNKRWITFQEPPENSSGKSGLDCAQLKAMTGGNTINARQIYQTKTDVHMTGTNVIECNVKPNLSDTGDSMGRRLEDIPYDSRFTTNKNEVDEENHIYYANTLYEQKNFQEELRIGVFHYFADIYYKLYCKTNSSQFDFTFSKVINNRNKEYLKENNFIYEWFDSLLSSSYECKSIWGSGMGHLERIEGIEKKNNSITFGEIYDEFKISNEYDNLEKKEKRELSKKKFLEKFIKIPIVQKDYQKDKKKKFGGILRGYKWIEKEYKEEIDEDDE